MNVGRFLAGVGALLWDPERNNYLILRRSAQKDFAAGAWECVTGRVDQGEGFEDALHREVFEELGISVEAMFIVGTTHFYRGDPLPENELVGVVYCCVSEQTEALRLSPEHDAYRWVTAEEARSLLASSDATEHWLFKVIERAEITRRLAPASLIDLHRQQGFELDAGSSA